MAYYIIKEPAYKFDWKENNPHLTMRSYSLKKEVIKYIEQMKEKSNKIPSYEEIASALSCRVDTVEQILRSKPISLDMELSHESGGASLSDLKATSIFEAAETSSANGSSIKEYIDEYITGLEPREAWVLALSSGIAKEESVPNKDIGLDIGLSRESVRKINATAVEKIGKMILKDLED